MSLSISSIGLFNADKFTIVRVQTLKCHYRVAVHREDECVTIQGPGVEETYSFDELGPSTLSSEAKALIAVCLFEEE